MDDVVGVKRGQTTVSPFNNGKIYIGTDGIVVELIDWPNETRFKQVCAEIVEATSGTTLEQKSQDTIDELLSGSGIIQGQEAGVLTFKVINVSRACTHQLVRTRTASFRQQSSRWTDMGDNFDVRIPQTVYEDKARYEEAVKIVQTLRNNYRDALNAGIPMQDARFLAPVGICTSLVASYPIRYFLATQTYRRCWAFQWEIRYVFNQMVEEVKKKFPALEPYLKVMCEKEKRCTYSGWEDTSGCPFPWAKKRKHEIARVADVSKK